MIVQNMCVLACEAPACGLMIFDDFESLQNMSAG